MLRARLGVGGMFGERGALSGLGLACPFCDWDMCGVAPSALHTLRFSPPERDKKALLKPH